jgi:hypothetical protein
MPLQIAQAAIPKTINFIMHNLLADYDDYPIQLE